MDLFNKKKLKEKEEWLDEIIQDRNKWEQAYINQVKDTNQLIKNNNNLTEENQKLIDWIEKIINKVGIKTEDDYEGQTINIPYYERTNIYKSIDNYRQEERKDIMIPSIKFSRTRYIGGK